MLGVVHSRGGGCCDKGRTTGDIVREAALCCAAKAADWTPATAGEGAPTATNLQPARGVWLPARGVWLPARGVALPLAGVALLTRVAAAGTPMGAWGAATTVTRPGLDE